MGEAAPGASCRDKIRHHLRSEGILPWLDFAVIPWTTGAVASRRAGPRNDAGLLDAYSNAVINVTERVGPGGSPGRDRIRIAPYARARRAGVGIVISPADWC